MDDHPTRDHKAWLAGVFDRAAPTYDHIGDAYHAHFAARMVDLAALPRDAQLLDVACGRGAVLQAAAARGLTHLTGIDFSPAMIDLARTDLEGAGVELLVMDAEQLEFPDGHFDALTAAFALFFLPDPARAAAEFHRVLRPGGVVVTSTWGEDDERWSFAEDLLTDAAAGFVGALQQPFDRAEDVLDLLGGAGFSDLRAHQEHTEIVFTSKDEWWEWRWSFSGRGILEQLTPDALAAYRAACFAAVEAVRTADGYPMQLNAHIVMGRKQIITQG